MRKGRRASSPPPSSSIFSTRRILFGWGLFNLVEGLVNHHILTLHHVREGVDNQTAYDLGFLALGLGLMLVGWFLARPRERDLSAAALS